MFNKKSIVIRYLAVFIIVLVLPILAINIVVYNAYLDTLLENSSDRILQALEQTSLGIENEVKRVSLTASTVSNDGDIVDMVTQWYRTEDSSQKLILSRQLDSKLSYLFNYTNDIDSVIFFFRNKGFYYYRNFPIISESEIRNSKWYKAAMNNDNNVVVLNTLDSFNFYTNGKPIFSVAVSPDMPSYRSDIELIYFSFKTNIFDGSYTGLKSNPIGEMVMLDPEGKVIAAGDEKIKNKTIHEFDYLKTAFENDEKSFTSMIEGKKAFISTYPVSRTKWKLVNLKDYQDLTNNMEKELTYFISIFSFVVVLFLGFSIFFFNDIIIPINSLIRKMKKVEKGDFDVSVEITGNGEIYSLGKSFNKMVSEIKTLIRERDIKERERSKAEIQALQAQINPHFLANTLNSIRLMAMISKADGIKNMTEAFMRLLTASFGRGGSFTTIAEELDTLENYIYIMKVRYGDRFDTSFEVQEDIKDCLILKMILQPILENAILHGMADMEEKGKIIMKGYKDGADILFEIMDNGVGMSEDEIKRILTGSHKDSKSFNSIGINNVDTRIKLNHGLQFGVRIESILGEYTNVRIVLPAIKDEKEEVNVV